MRFRYRSQGHFERTNMSYIDTLHHEQVGSLAGYPLYHPTMQHKNDEGWGAADFAAGPQNLVLGGGSGEHPGLVVHKFDQIVRLYLLHVIDLHVGAGTERSPEFEAFEDELLRGLEVRFDRWYEFCGWGIEQMATLLERAKAGPNLGTPYDPDVHTSVEHWLAYSLGEFCVMDMPDLAGSDMARLLARHEPQLQELRSYWMANVVYTT